MAAITALQKVTVNDTPNYTVQEIRRQWNAFVDAIAALDSSTAAASDVVTALQKAVKVVYTLELPKPPKFPTPLDRTGA